MEDRPIYELEKRDAGVDPDETPIKDRRIFTQPYDLVVEALIKQIDGGTIFLRPLSQRPVFQRRYVWPDVLASRLVESILLNVPIPPCYLSQNDDYELDVIDGQQRLFSLFRFHNNQLNLQGLEVLNELNGLRFYELPPKIQRQFETYTLRCVVITNESHPEIKFDVFERLNTNTVPLNAQELRNCVYRGTLNALLQDVVMYEPWLRILNKKSPDKRMRDEELALRFYGFYLRGLETYRTPQKHWLNETAKNGRKLSEEKRLELISLWSNSIDISLVWFSPQECFRRFPLEKSGPINRALFDLVMHTASKTDIAKARRVRERFRNQYTELFLMDEFNDLISRAVDHTKRTKRRFEIWNQIMGQVFA